ncbi:glycosyltransferase family 15 protein [Zopfia rhizophila CBS 207.26]|uniref:Glycosyltransferase family 15 protein n=1 Tax=Zopfia rhizophila CBS 207.26 TaxID=1314779 RepID=A0A6A6EE01_9PEZI|nr:glycosyltransferase family 15 protein [Zopfia rhizophila CBS 207.26]
MPRLLKWPSVRWRPLLLIFLGLALEDLFHQYRYYVPRPSQPLDAPFQIGCQDPKTDAARENATIIMLTRNEDVDGAAASILSLENHFNRWFHYPVIFLNDKPWSNKFITTLTEIVSGEVKFEVIPAEMWDYPKWMNKEDAKERVAAQGANGIYKGGLESYHHMCRFYSGKFYDVEGLKPYKWYWRVEPNIQLSCAVTYDPFVKMVKYGKKYGYTIALWEVGNTVPSLFRLISDYKKEKHLKTTDLWKSMIKASWVPIPFRFFLSLLPSRDASGDAWNLCHYWSNFEIADMDFFRSREYRELFDFLDGKGGFYFERWGDASIHSLAAALFLPPHQLHHFQDFGYFHEPWRVCPANARGGQLPNSEFLAVGDGKWMEERDGGIGCRCECEAGRNFQSVCFNKLRQATNPR